MEKRGRQLPTNSVVLPYVKTLSTELIDIYNQSGKIFQEWQTLLLSDILGVNKEGEWVHKSFGFEVPRQNGKGDIIMLRDLYGLLHGEKILHTAHRTATSRSAWERLQILCDDVGLPYKISGALGQEKIRLYDNEGKVMKGRVEFRTRSSKGGIGETFDCLIIDEAQEYTQDQASALKYTIAANPNSQTLYCGTPPTPDTAGTVFIKRRKSVLAGGVPKSGWAEWSIDEKTDVHNKDAWYLTNPSLGLTLTEDTITEETLDGDDLDFNVQRLGLWISYNLASEISRAEWLSMQCASLPKLKGKMFVGIKFGKDGTNVAMSIAIKTNDDKIFVESIDCKSIRSGDKWITDWLKGKYIQNIVIDGASGQKKLEEELRVLKMKRLVVLPTVLEVITANTIFRQEVEAKRLQHMGQKSLAQIASNVEKRAIGSSGGFGFKSIKPGADVALLDSVILAIWACSVSKEKKVQSIKV